MPIVFLMLNVDKFRLMESYRTAYIIAVLALVTNATVIEIITSNGVVGY